MKHKLRILALTLALSLPLAGPVVADQYEDGLAAFVIGEYTAAFRLWQPLAEQGNADAQKLLGLMYDLGLGVAHDSAAAAKWYRLAADQGDAGAQYALGVRYRNGSGVPQDYVQSYMWCSLAATSGHEDAIYHRDIVAAMMTPDQIAEAQKLAREWKPKPAAQ